MTIIKKTDIVVIGGGVTGTAILRELSKYNITSILLEKEPDIATGTTKANSAILHAGFDAKPGSMKARMNIAGNALYHEIAEELELDIQWTGSLVVATTAEEMQVLENLYNRGCQNEIPGLEIWNRERVLAQEPNLRNTVAGALWAPTAGICWPFSLAIAFAENAIHNGADVIRCCPVIAIEMQSDGYFAVKTPKGTIITKYVINAAGLYADTISAMVGDTSFTIHPRKGEYVLFDKAVKSQLVQGIVFPTPSATSKGVLVCTTTHGNTFIGPDAQDLDDKNDTAVTQMGMDAIILSAQKLIPHIPLKGIITEFSGLRAISDTNDFIIRESTVSPGMFHAAGIQSPGLTSAPAIGQYILSLITAKDPTIKKKKTFDGHRPALAAFRELPRSKQAECIKNNSLYGRVICRCETVTEAEIIDAIHRPCGARTVDGVKRRTRAGMGRCQGGFCGPRITHILARELNIPITAVCKEIAGSQLFYDKGQIHSKGDKQ